MIEAHCAELSTRIDAVETRIDTLPRVIWSLLVLLASTVFGLLYRVVTFLITGVEYEVEGLALISFTSAASR